MSFVHDHGYVQYRDGLEVKYSQMRLIDQGRIEIPHYIEHRRRCPDCRKNRKPSVPPPASCWNCSGGFVWLAPLGRMGKCAICRGTAIVTPRSRQR